MKNDSHSQQQTGLEDLKRGGGWLKSSHRVITDIATNPQPMIAYSVADQKVMCKECVPAPPGQNFFIFMQYLGNIGQIIGWHPLGLAHPSEKS